MRKTILDFREFPKDADKNQCEECYQIRLYGTFWGFWTALLRPLVGMPVWDFVERWANWGAPLALLLLVGWPKTIKECFK